jgi:hypothetical protein
MSIGLKPNADGSAEVLVNGVTKLKINADGGVNDGRPMFNVYKNVDQTGLAHQTWNKITFQTKEWDTNNFFDAVTNFRFQPTIAGWYQFSAAATISSPINANGVRVLSLYKTGQEVRRGTTMPGTTSDWVTTTVSGLIYLNGSTDYVETYLYHSTGAAVTVNGGGGRLCTYFDGFLARGA